VTESDVERLEVGALSETGYVRDENQDRMSGSVVPLGHLYIVADGMGGHKAGALAAQMAVEELQRHIGGAPASDPADAVIAAAFKAANDAVYGRSHSGDSATEGMGTTAVLLLISGRVAKVAHVGDSRAYLYRNGSLSQLTTDHTIVQRMVQAGMLKPEEAADHPQSSMLERAIGSAQNVEVDLRSHPLQSGDALLLCSDGLSGYVSDVQIEDVLRNERTVQETTADLVRLALDKGGRDNVTVQVVRYGPRKATPTPAPTVRQTRPTAVLKAPAVPGGGQVPRKPDTKSYFLPAAIVGVVAVAGVAVFLLLDGTFHGFPGSNVSTPVSAPSVPEPQQPVAAESKPAASQTSDRQPKTPPASSGGEASLEALKQQLAARDQELATAKLDLANARKRIDELAGQVAELTKAARGAPSTGGGKSPDSSAPKASKQRESPAPKGTSKPNGTPVGSPALPGPPPAPVATPAATPATPAATPETWVPVTPQPGAAESSPPPPPPSGAPEPPPVKPTSDGG
jgi:serine/threonine protein phosphatase PrpC